MQGKKTKQRFLDGYETWSLIFMEEHKLRVFEKRVLRKIFWP
jgi:hypothetical protein